MATRTSGMPETGGGAEASESPGDPAILRRVTSARELMEVRCPLSPRPPTVSASGSGPSAGRPATRSATPRARRSTRSRRCTSLAELGAYGVTLPRRRPDPVRQPTTRRAAKHIDRFKAALEETGLVVPMMTTNLFTHPVFKDGGFTSNDRAVRRFALRKVMRNLDLAAAARRAHVRVLGRARGQRVRRREGRPGARSTATARPSTRWPDTCRTRATASGSRIEPKPNEPRGDILLPTVGHALAFIAEPRAPRDGRAEPRGRPRADGRAELRPRHRAGAVARQAVPHRPQRPARHQVRPGPGLRPRRPAQRVLPGRPAGVRRHRRRPGLRRAAALRLQAVPHRGHGRACGPRRRRTCARTCC